VLLLPLGMQHALHKRKASDLVPPPAAADMQQTSSAAESMVDAALHLGAYSLVGLSSKVENEDTYVACRLPWLEGAGEAAQVRRLARGSGRSGANSSGL
jgi:hypothetical protein